MTPMNLTTGLFISILFGPLVGYWCARAVEYLTDWTIIPDLDWDEE